MKCPSCNKENLEDVKFCGGCGINFEEILKCKDCNAELAHDDSFCSACGKPVEQASEPVSEENNEAKDAPSVSSIEPKEIQPLEQVHLQDTNRFESKLAGHAEDVDEDGEGLQQEFDNLTWTEEALENLKKVREQEKQQLIHPHHSQGQEEEQRGIWKLEAKDTPPEPETVSEETTESIDKKEPAPSTAPTDIGARNRSAEPPPPPIAGSSGWNYKNLLWAILGVAVVVLILVLVANSSSSPSAPTPLTPRPTATSIPFKSKSELRQEQTAIAISKAALMEKARQENPVKVTPTPKPKIPWRYPTATAQAKTTATPNPQVVANEPFTLGNVHFIKGDENLADQNYAEAIKSYTEGLGLFPRNAKAYSARGLSYFHLKNYQEAIRNFSVAIKLDPNFVDAYNNRGAANHRLGKYTEALSDFDYALQLDPSHKLALSNKEKVSTSQQVSPTQVPTMASVRTSKPAPTATPTLVSTPKPVPTTTPTLGIAKQIESHLDNADYLLNNPLPQKGSQPNANAQRAAEILDEYTKAIALTPRDNDLEGRRLLAIAYHERGKILHYCAIYGNLNGMKDIYADMPCESQGDSEKAIEDISLAIEIHPKGPVTDDCKYACTAWNDPIALYHMSRGSVYSGCSPNNVCNHPAATQYLLAYLDFEKAGELMGKDHGFAWNSLYELRRKIGDWEYDHVASVAASMKPQAPRPSNDKMGPTLLELSYPTEIKVGQVFSVRIKASDPDGLRSAHFRAYFPWHKEDSVMKRSISIGCEFFKNTRLPYPDNILYPETGECIAKSYPGEWDFSGPEPTSHSYMPGVDDPFSGNYRINEIELVDRHVNKCYYGQDIIRESHGYDFTQMGMNDFHPDKTIDRWANYYTANDLNPPKTKTILHKRCSPNETNYLGSDWTHELHEFPLPDIVLHPPD